MNTKGTTEEFFLASYDAYQDAIFRYVLFQTNNREVALDLTQETFAKAWEYLVSGKTIDMMRPFLYRIAGNLVIDYRRKKKSDSLDSMMENGFDPGATEDEDHADRFEREQVLQIVGQIEEKYRDVIIMRYIEDMSVKDMAKVTGETENAISVRIHRGLEKVRTTLAHHEHD